MTTYTESERLDGITKARLVANIALAQSGQPLHVDDAAYLVFVCTSANIETLPDTAADSYYEQYANKTVEELEQELVDAVNAAPDYEPNVTPTVSGVPQSVTRRQAKTIMELSPHPIHGDLWQAALAAANAILDNQTRIVTVNYLLESLKFERPQVLILASSLLGMTEEQVDALFIAANTL